MKLTCAFVLLAMAGVAHAEDKPFHTSSMIKCEMGISASDASAKLNEALFGNSAYGKTKGDFNLSLVIERPFNVSQPSISVQGNVTEVCVTISK